MKNINCPLCKNEKFIILSNLNKDEIINNYKKEFNLDIKYLFKNKEINEFLEKRLCSNCGIYYFSENISGDNNFYSELSKGDQYYSENKWEFDIAIEKILEHKNLNSILEIGCGGGFFLEKIKNNFNEVYGSEFNKNAIEICKNKGINIYDCSLEKINKKFDIIVNFQVFEHINNISEILNNSFNLLNKNGLLLISVPNAEGYLKYTKDILDIPPHHVLGWTKKSFDYLESFGFKLIDYKKEEINANCYYSYLLSKYVINKKTSKIKIKIFDFIIKTIVFLRYTLLDIPKHIDGHSHIAIFLKS